MNYDEIKGLLGNELSAVETYERAVGERAWDLLRAEQTQHLVNILVDHLAAASQLQAEIQQITSTPVDGTEKREIWFTWGLEARRLFGDAELLATRPRSRR